jgi:hypothetical protein
MVMFALRLCLGYLQAVELQTRSGLHSDKGALLCWCAFDSWDSSAGMEMSHDCGVVCGWVHCHLVIMHQCTAFMGFTNSITPSYLEPQKILYIDKAMEWDQSRRNQKQRDNLMLFDTRIRF